MKSFTIKKILFLTLILGTYLVSSLAYSAFQLFPTRLILSDQVRTGEITVTNRSNRVEVYKISAVYFHMMQDGSLRLHKSPKQPKDSAIELLRFSPKVIRLRPNEQQVIRVLVRKVPNLKEAEYRAHIRCVPKDPPLPTEKDKSKKEYSFSLHAKMAVSVPIIYRNGAPKIKIALKNLKLFPRKDAKKSSQIFSVEMIRKGPGFPSGDFFIYFKPKKGKRALVGQVKGVATYRDFRVAQYLIYNNKNETLKNGTLTLEFRQTESVGGKLLAQVETAV